MHVHLEITPQLLSIYDKKVCAKFEKLFDEVYQEFRDSTHGLRYDDPETIVALRGVFDDLAEFVEDAKKEDKRKFAASLRLYARLPLASFGSDSTFFYPAAMLPSTKWLSAKGTLWITQWKLTREAIAVVSDFLRDPNAY